MLAEYKRDTCCDQSNPARLVNPGAKCLICFVCVRVRDSEWINSEIETINSRGKKSVLLLASLRFTLSIENRKGRERKERERSKLTFNSFQCKAASRAIFEIS